MQLKGILSFPELLAPKAFQAGAEEKYSLVLLFAPGDPQIAQIQKEYDAAKAAKFPDGMPKKANECFMSYDDRYEGVSHYRPDLSGYYTLSATAKLSDKPALVNMDLSPLSDPTKVFPGAVVWANINVCGYNEGVAGIGGWLNGVMFTDEEPPMGRFDNKPTVEQMFSGVASEPTPPTAPAPAPAPPSAPVAPTGPVMTATATCTYEQYIGAGWNDQQLIDAGFMNA